MVAIAKQVQMDLPTYKGPDRRGDEQLIVTQCGCHPKHERVLSDHDKRIDALTKDINERRKEIDSRMERGYKDLVRDVVGLEKSKVTNRLFYLFISVYSVLFIGGIITVYTGMNRVDKNLTVQMGDLKTEVKVIDTKVSSHVTASNEIKQNQKDMNKKLDNHIHQTSNGNAHGG